jgi:hypothetical protein
MIKEKNKMKNDSKRSNKKTRGYRLKPETHSMIVKIQNLLGSDQDEAIAAACTLLYAELQKTSPAK